MSANDSTLQGRDAWASKVLAPMVGEVFDGDDPCWLAVREALRRLGVELPETYLAARGCGVDLGPAQDVRPAPGDVVHFERRGGERAHLGVCVSPSLLLHTLDEPGGGRVVVGPFRRLVDAAEQARVIRPNALIGEGGER